LLGSPAVVEKELIIWRCLEQLWSMLTMAIPDVEILAIHLFTVCFNLLASWHSLCGLRDGKFEGI